MNVEQARARYETAAAQSPQIKSEIAVLENALSIRLGKNPGTIPRGKDDLRRVALLGDTWRAAPSGAARAQARPLAKRSSSLTAVFRTDRRCQRSFSRTDLADVGARLFSEHRSRPVVQGSVHLWSYGGGIRRPRPPSLRGLRQDSRRQRPFRRRRWISCLRQTERLGRRR